MEPENQEGLCECGCGKPAPIAKQTSKRDGYVAGEPMRFVHGHHFRGVKRPESTRRKMSESMLARFASMTEEERKRGPMPEWWKERIRETRPRGEKHWNWRGGRTYGNGYRAILAPDNPMANKEGYVAEHRLVMSKHLGRPLLPTEDVHHINGDKLDNRLENLAVIDHGKHSSTQRRRLHSAAVRGLLAEGLSVAEVAEHLHMSPATIRRYAQ